MKVGITYDLRDDYLAMGFSEEETAEFDSSGTIEGIEDALRRLNHQTDRIGHLKTLAARLLEGERWDLVFNIAEGLYGFGREAQVPALLDAWNIPYTFSDPCVLCLTMHKGFAKQVIRDSGIPTPDFAVVSNPDEASLIRLPFPLFVKPVSEGTGKGVSAASKVMNGPDLRHACADLIIRFKQPAIVETFLPGREFTVGIVGSGNDSRVIGLMEVLLLDNAEQGSYSYHNKENYTEKVRYVIPDGSIAAEASEVALASWKALGCRDGGRVDLRQDATGRVNFIEVNPLAGLNPIKSDLPILCRMGGIPYQELIAAIMESAQKRIDPALSA
jgi:D-alanine-D-alanine ligase